MTPAATTDGGLATNTVIAAVSPVSVLPSPPALPVGSTGLPEVPER